MVVGGSPLGDGQWGPVWLTAGLAVLAVGLVVGVREARRHRWVRWGVRVAAALVVVAAVGVVSTPRVGDRPLLVFSEEARMRTLISRADRDLRTVAEADEVAGLDVVDARTRYRDIERLVSELATIRDRWSGIGPGDTPDPAMAVVADRLSVAAHWMGVAVSIQQDLLVSPTARGELERDAARQTAAEALLEAGRTLAEVARSWGVPLNGPGAGVGE